MRKIEESTPAGRTPEVDKNKKEDKRNGKKGSFLFPVIMVILIGVILFSGYQVISILTERVEGAEIYEELDEYITVDRKETEKITYRDFVERAPNIYVNFDKLQEQNPDVCGWIIFPNTKINYPVVKGKDNSYYLSHTSTKQRNSCGAIFMDMNCDREFGDAKTIIYGHRMNNGSMFENLLKYREQAFYDENPAGILITPKGSFMLSIIGAREVEDDLKYYRTGFSHDDEFRQEIEILTSGSLIQCIDSADMDDDVVMLSTCVKGDHSVRFIVMAKIVSMDEFFKN